MSNGLAHWKYCLFPALFFFLSSFPPSSSSLLLHPSIPSISTTYFFLQTNQLIPHSQEYLITTSNMSQQVAEVAKILQEQDVDLVEYGHQLQFRFGNSAATSKVYYSPTLILLYYILILT